MARVLGRMRDSSALRSWAQAFSGLRDHSLTEAPVLLGESQSALIAGRFDDGVIVGSQEGVIEEENGFFSRGNDDELGELNLLVNGGKNFAKPGRAGRFGIATPMLQEGVMGASFEGEKLFDGLRFGVRGREQVLGREFILGHVLFDPEWRDLHKRECDKGGRRSVQNQIDCEARSGTGSREVLQGRQARTSPGPKKRGPSHSLSPEQAG